MRKQNENLDKHHVSRNPPKVVLIPHREHETVHGNVPIVSQLNLLIRQYDKLTQLLVMVQNWESSYEREFGEKPTNTVNLREMEKKRKIILKDAESILTDDIPNVKHIKGLGIRYLAGLLAYAHPKRFPNIGRYLYYCGYTKASKITKRYNRKVCSLVYQVVKSLIICRDDRYYSLYLKIKSEQPSKFSKIKRHRIAVNRVGTLFLKEFYGLFKQ